MMCVYLNWFCAETRRGVRCSGRKPVKVGESANKTCATDLSYNYSSFFKFSSCPNNLNAIEI